MIDLFIDFDGLSYTIPVNPKELTPSRSASNTNIDIIGLGKATRKGEPGLQTLKIQSFFPNPKSKYYKNIKASTYIAFIEKIWHTENINNKVAHISSYGISKDIGGKELDMYFVIEKFDYSYNGGDFDTAYSLTIKEYREYGVKVIEQNFTDGMKSARTPSTVKENIPQIMQDTQPTTEAKTYTVVSGDSLYSITKRCTGDGSNWATLYELNKSIIGGNPNLLYAGQVLTLPENWNSPKAKVNISTSAKVKSSSTNKQTTLNNSTTVKTTETIKETTKTTEPDLLETNPGYIEWLSYKNEYSEHVNYLNYIQSIRGKGFVTQEWATDWGIDENSKRLQQYYNNAKKIIDDNTKTTQEKATAIREIREQELKYYRRMQSGEFYNSTVVGKKAKDFDKNKTYYANGIEANQYR